MKRTTLLKSALAASAFTVCSIIGYNTLGTRDEPAAAYNPGIGFPAFADELGRMEDDILWKYNSSDLPLVFSETGENIESYVDSVGTQLGRMFIASGRYIEGIPCTEDDLEGYAVTEIRKGADGFYATFSDPDGEPLFFIRIDSAGQASKEMLMPLPEGEPDLSSYPL